MDNVTYTVAALLCSFAAAVANTLGFFRVTCFTNRRESTRRAVYQRDALAPGEQLNFIGYSGGATVAFDAAVVLQYATGRNFAHRIIIDNIVTLGGFVFRGKPGNVTKWTEVVGTLDPIATRNPYAYAIDQEVGISHLPVPFTEISSYVTGNGIPLTVNIIRGAGLR